MTVQADGTLVLEKQAVMRFLKGELSFGLSWTVIETLMDRHLNLMDRHLTVHDGPHLPGPSFI